MALTEQEREDIAQRINDLRVTAYSRKTTKDRKAELLAEAAELENTPGYYA